MVVSLNHLHTITLNVQMSRLWNALKNHAVSLGLLLALFAITVIGVGGMATSVLVAQEIQGSGSAINVAGSLRRLSHRMGSLVLADAANQNADRQVLRTAIVQFTNTLAHPALVAILEQRPESGFARTYAEVHAIWHSSLEPVLEAELNFPVHPADAHGAAAQRERHNTLLQLIDIFVDRLNFMVAQLEADTEQRIHDLRRILGLALVLTVLLFTGAVAVLQRGILRPLNALVANATRLARGDFSARSERVGSDELGRLGDAFNRMAEELSKLYRDLENKVAEKSAALTRSNQTLALQEERSIIARELHDSIAQALSYLKIQAALLQPILAEPARRPEAEATLRDLREGISAAYRQLRELLATFRLKMEGDFAILLQQTVEEFSTRSGMAIALRTDLADCLLSPNQEIHSLQIVREALSNVTRHAQAKHAWVEVTAIAHTEAVYLVTIKVADDGRGFALSNNGAGATNELHYGLAIMRERAEGLRGTLTITPRELQGTCVQLQFRTETDSQVFGDSALERIDSVPIASTQAPSTSSS